MGKKTKNRSTENDEEERRADKQEDAPVPQPGLPTPSMQESIARPSRIYIFFNATWRAGSTDRCDGHLSGGRGNRRQHPERE